MRPMISACWCFFLHSSESWEMGGGGGQVPQPPPCFVNRERWLSTMVGGVVHVTGY